MCKSQIFIFSFQLIFHFQVKENNQSFCAHTENKNISCELCFHSLDWFKCSWTSLWRFPGIQPARWEERPQVDRPLFCCQTKHNISLWPEDLDSVTYRCILFCFVCTSGEWLGAELLPYWSFWFMEHSESEDVKTHFRQTEGPLSVQTTLRSWKRSNHFEWMNEWMNVLYLFLNMYLVPCKKRVCTIF